MSPFFYAKSHCRSSFLLLHPNKCVSVTVEFTAGGCVFLTTASPHKGPRLSCAEEANDVMFPAFQPTSQLLQKGRAVGTHFTRQEQSGSCLPLARPGLCWVGALGAGQWSRHFYMTPSCKPGLTGFPITLLASAHVGMERAGRQEPASLSCVPWPTGSAGWGRELGKAGHFALAQPSAESLQSTV